MPNILITGASSGLGAALAEVYAEPGNNLILYGRDQQRLDEIAALCRQRGAVVEPVSFDIRNIDPLVTSMQEIDSRKPLDLAILNAGLGGIADVDRISESPERSHEMSLVNFVSPVVIATAVGELMGARGHGRIVLVGSLAEAFPLPMAPTYSGTKAGLAMFAEALELRLMKRGVGVTLVSPGFIDTPMSRSVPPPKPFLMTPRNAAALIRRKIDGGARRLVLPWQFALILGLSRWVPRSLIRRFCEGCKRQSANGQSAAFAHRAVLHYPQLLSVLTCMSDSKLLGVLDGVRSKEFLLATMRVVRWVFPAALLVYLGYSLYELGWAQIRQSLPNDWLFYALLLLSFFIQPVADLIVYRHLWKTAAPIRLAVFLRKRFMNGTLFAYSGEGYLFLWAKQNLQIPKGMLLHAIKDSNLLSATAALVVFLGLLIVLALSGQWQIPVVLDGNLWIYAAVVCFPLVLGAGFVLARNKVTALRGDQIAFTFAVHCVRTVVSHASQVALWSLAMPAIPLAAWLNFLAFRILVSRLSFVGANGILLVTTGIAFAGTLGLPPAGIAGVLLTIFAAEQLLTAVLVGVPWLIGRGPLVAQANPAR